MSTIDLSQLSSNWKRLQATRPPGEKVDRAPSLASRAASTGPRRKTRKLDTDREIPIPPQPARDSLNGQSRGRPRSTPALRARKARAHSMAPSEELRRPASAQNHTAHGLAGAENEGVSRRAIAGKYIALDCEMVGYGPNPNKDSQLARVSVVNYHGDQLYDSYVLPVVPVTDYRTPITGISAATLNHGRPFKEVQRDVAAFLKGRVLIGHALNKDLHVLMLGHPRKDVRDTSRHATYRALSAGKTPALKKLCKELLGIDIQQGAHSSVEDARAAMLLYKREKDTFEAEFAGKFGKRQITEAAVQASEGETELKKRTQPKKRRR